MSEIKQLRTKVRTIYKDITESYDSINKGILKLQLQKEEIYQLIVGVHALMIKIDKTLENLEEEDE